MFVFSQKFPASLRHSPPLHSVAALLAALTLTAAVLETDFVVGPAARAVVLGSSCCDSSRAEVVAADLTIVTTDC